MEADFSGYATKAGLKCSDGLTITAEAFKHMDGMKLPLVWQHGHNKADNVLGHAKLEARGDGVYAYAFCNETPQGKNAKMLVEHGDITMMSIYANQLVKKGSVVTHGMIREVSLVLAGANPGAKIDWVSVRHSDGDIEALEDEAIIHTGLKFELEHAEEDTSSDEGDETLQDAYNNLSDEAKNVVHAMVEAALELTVKSDAAEHSEDKADDSDGDDKKTDEGDLNHQEGADMSRNVFEQQGTDVEVKKHTLSHADVQGIMADAVKIGSLKEAAQNYALQHGIENLEVLFPDAQTLSNTPEWIKRRTEWVSGVLGGVRRSPFSRVRTILADITMEEARAKGYIKGNFKKEEFFSVTKRTTGPTTVYKKQKLDRDDVVDITDFDVVAWIKGEMRLMLEEELARAILIGDGRDVSDEDKIKDPVGQTDGLGIRSILNEHELFATVVNVNVGATPDYYEVVKAVKRGMQFYHGTGTPTFYTTRPVLVEMLLTEDSFGRPRWETKEALAAALMVDRIVEVEVMQDHTDLFGIIVNLGDYNVGADKGGEVTLFDDFDIDYNQLKWLIETRISGALVKYKSALVVKRVSSSNVLATPVMPTFVESTGVVTIPTVTGVTYVNADTDATLTPGAQSALAEGATLNVLATADSGYYFATNAEDEWSFTRPAA